MHYHSIEDNLVTGTVANIQDVEGGRYRSLECNGQTYYFVTGCGLDSLSGTQTLFWFPIRLELALGAGASTYHFCMLPPNQSAGGKLLILTGGKNGCDTKFYINETTHDVHSYTEQTGNITFYFIVCPYIDDSNGNVGGHLFRFIDIEVLNDWNYEISSYLAKPGSHYNDIQGGVYVPIIVNLNLPYDYSPVVTLNIVKPC